MKSSLIFCFFLIITLLSPLKRKKLDLTSFFNIILWSR
nr:MAG TPA: hypothetical protein [Caudoviricetes sp.]